VSAGTFSNALERVFLVCFPGVLGVDGTRREEVVMSSFVPADLFVIDPEKNPLEGVTARLMSADGKKVHSQHVSDAHGHIGLLLPAPNTYQVRFYKFSVSFGPILIDVREAPAKNNFNVYGEPVVWPMASDPRLCVASGFFRDVTGAPKSFQDLHFVADFSPFVLDNATVANERRSIRTDEKGWAEISLIRCAIYGVTMEGWQDQFRRVTVPDRSSVNMAFLLFPRVDRIESPADTFVVRKGKTVEVPVAIFTTDERKLDSINTDVIWTSSNESIFIISTRSLNSLTLTGVGRGSANLTARRMPNMQGGDPPVYYPDTPIKGVPIAVNVI
jgi:hypothetical protein